MKQVEVKKGVPKRVKYAGLLFSGITPVQLPKEVIVEQITSIKNQKYDFTDGPGLISMKLAIWVKLQRRQYKLLRSLKPSNMTVDRIKKLEEIGFVFNLHDPCVANQGQTMHNTISHL